MDKKKPSPEFTEDTKTPGKRPSVPLPRELNGFESRGLKEPTRYGDWDVKGRCSDF